MSRKRFPASLPRRMYWSDEVGGCASCPECGGGLEREQHTYVAATRRHGDTDMHVIGNDAGQAEEDAQAKSGAQEAKEEKASMSAEPPTPNPDVPPRIAAPAHNTASF